MKMFSIKEFDDLEFLAQVVVKYADFIILRLDVCMFVFCQLLGNR